MYKVRHRRLTYRRCALTFPTDASHTHTKLIDRLDVFANGQDDVLLAWPRARQQRAAAVSEAVGVKSI